MHGRSFFAIAFSVAMFVFPCAEVHADQSDDFSKRRTISAQDFGGFVPAATGVRGIGVDPIMCVTAVDCAQPGDFTTFINASFFDAAEVMEFGQNSNLTEICTSFAFAGGSCAAPGDPSFLALWTWDFFPVDAAGIPSAGTVATFDTEFPLANLTVEALLAGTVAGFPVLNMKFELGDFDTGAGVVTGFPVEAGACLAMMPKFAMSGCSAFWETSSNADGTASGDGLSLQGPAMDGFDVCDYAANDLLLCLDVLTTQPPSCTSAAGTGAPSNDDCTGASTRPLVCDAENVQCILFATSDTANDPVLMCAQGEPDGFTGTNTVWYTFEPSGSRALLSMCRVGDGINVGGGNDPFPNGDFLLAVYVVADMPGEGEGPCNLVLIACSDNTCEGNKPFLCLNDLDTSTTYLVQVAGHDVSDGVQITLDVTCDNLSIPPVPANDDCINAEEFVFTQTGGISTAFVSGSTVCSSPDPLAGGGAGTTNGNSPGNWYTAIGDGFEWELTMCIPGGGDYDSQINVYCGDCTTGLICVAGNDDGYCVPYSSFVFCTEVGRRYYIYVHGFFDIGNYRIEITVDPDFTFEMCENDPTHAELCEICVGDCDMDGSVGFNDLVAMLFNFGLDFVPPECDPTGDGETTFDDLVATLFLFGPCP